jgi:hypothetical protein
VEGALSRGSARTVVLTEGITSSKAPQSPAAPDGAVGALDAAGGLHLGRGATYIQHTWRKLCGFPLL